MYFAVTSENLSDKFVNWCIFLSLESQGGGLKIVHFCGVDIQHQISLNPILHTGSHILMSV